MKIIIKLMTGAIIGLLILSGCTSQISKPPNIVWITSEDNSMHYLKMFTENGVETPHIESLSTDGLTFMHAFSNAPVCSSARSTLISGCYGPRVASHYHRKIQQVPLPDSLKMFPAYLQEAGYYTSNNAKEDYNFIKSKNVWDESSKTATWKNRQKDQPFFHVHNIHTTHESRLHFTKEQIHKDSINTGLNSFSVQPNHPQTDLFRFTNAFYRDKIQQMDNEVGTIIAELKKDGLYQNTIIFYFGDHGGVLPGSKGYLYETGLHVPLVIHVPEKYQSLVNHQPGVKISGFVSFVDFAPTVLNLAGIDVPSTMDGVPFLGKGVSLQEVDARDETFSYADRFDEKYDMVRALRKGRYKYVRSYQPFNVDGLMNNYRYKQLAYLEWLELFNSGELNETQSAFFESRQPEMLFDIQADPFETKNLVNEQEYQQVRDELRKTLDQKLMGMPDLSFYPEFHLISNAFHNPAQFGQDHAKDIAKYIHLANLSLEGFDQSKAALESGLGSTDQWERYWALVVCSIYGKGAAEFEPLIGEIARQDTELINRVRAAEFLGITQYQDPSELLSQALYQSDDAAESLLVLNSIVLMQTEFDYEFELNLDKISPLVLENPEVQRRLEFLVKA